MNVSALIIQLLSGAVAGNIVCSACPNVRLRLILGSVIGMIGGALAAQALLHVCGGVENATDMQIYLASIAGGAAGGFVLTGLIGLIKCFSCHRR